MVSETVTIGLEKVLYNSLFLSQTKKGEPCVQQCHTNLLTTRRVHWYRDKPT